MFVLDEMAFYTSEDSANTTHGKLLPAQPRCAPRCKGGHNGRSTGLQSVGASVAASKGSEFGCKYCLFVERGQGEPCTGDGGELVSMCEQGKASKVIPEGSTKGSRGSGEKASSPMVVENNTR